MHHQCRTRMPVYRHRMPAAQGQYKGQDLRGLEADPFCDLIRILDRNR